MIGHNRKCGGKESQAKAASAIHALCRRQRDPVFDLFESTPLLAVASRRSIYSLPAGVLQE